MVWVIFPGAAAAIVVSGWFLARSGDDLARRTGLGGLWFGAVLMSLVTSLPELVTDVSAVRQGAPNLALGDLFGSSMANMAILASVTLVFRTRRLLQSVALENVLTASLAVFLTALALAFAITTNRLSIGSVALGPIALAITYLVGMAVMRERQAGAGHAEEREFQGEMTCRAAVLTFGAASGVILISGPLLAGSGKEIADLTGLGQTFFGTLFLAAVTSLPELAVSISAMRLGALNLTIGNLMGSNATNMAIILPLELASPEHDVLAAADQGLVLAATVSILMMAIGVAAIVLKAERRRVPIDPAAVSILVIYVLGIAAVYGAS